MGSEVDDDVARRSARVACCVLPEKVSGAETVFVMGAFEIARGPEKVPSEYRTQVP